MTLEQILDLVGLLVDLLIKKGGLKLINYSFDSCKHLVLFTSESCNLQCSYCDMNKHFNNKYHLNEANLVKESMKNGVYLNNLKQIFQRLGIDPSQINNLDLWGQEPTLTLNEFSIMFQELYKYCPNINNLFFSTNGVGFIDSIISFIKTIDLIVKYNFQLNYQLNIFYIAPTRPFFYLIP